MTSSYLFSLQPTFTQGLVIGQLSIFILLGLILKYLFLDSTEREFETSSYHPRLDRKALKQPLPSLVKNEGHESTEWLNEIMQQVLNVYRSRLRDRILGPEGDELMRARVEKYANQVRPQSVVDHITVHSIDIGSSAPKLCNGRKTGGSSPSQLEFDIEYVDSVSISLSTAYLFNYPKLSFARLPVSLTVSLSVFKARLTVTTPSLTSSDPILQLDLHPSFTLDLASSSLLGSRAKLANVPKLHELIQHQVRRILASHSTWKIPLPGLSTVERKPKQEVVREIKEELQDGLA